MKLSRRRPVQVKIAGGGPNYGLDLYLRREHLGLLPAAVYVQVAAQQAKQYEYKATVSLDERELLVTLKPRKVRR